MKLRAASPHDSAEPVEVGFEAAGRHDDAVRGKDLDTSRSTHLDAGARLPIKPQVDDFGLVADIDPLGRCSPVVRVDECLATTEEEAVGPGQMQGPAQRRLPPDPVIRHPARKRHRLRHEQLDQRRPGVLRVKHVDVVDEFLGRIWIDHEVVDLEVGDPDVPRVARVAAAHMARCPLDKRDLCACVTRRERRAEAGVPASNDDHASGHAVDASRSGLGSTNYRSGYVPSGLHPAGCPTARH